MRKECKSNTCAIALLTLVMSAMLNKLTLKYSFLKDTHMLTHERHLTAPKKVGDAFKD